MQQMRILKKGVIVVVEELFRNTTKKGLLIFDDLDKILDNLPDNSPNSVDRAEFLENNFTDFLWVFLGVVIFVIIKKSLDFSLIYLLQIKNILGDFLIDKSKSFYANIFLVYVLLILTEFTQLSENHLLWFTALFFLYRFVFIVIKNKKLIFNKLFYFILYICTLEIAPLLIIYKFVLKA